MQLIVPLRGTIIADEAGCFRIAGDIDGCTIHRQKAIATECFTVLASRVKIVEYILKHVWRDICATLGNGGRCGINADTVKFFCKRTTVCSNQQMNGFFNRQFTGTSGFLDAECARYTGN